VSTSEPEWDAEQLNLLLAYEELLRSRGSHGFPMDVATDAKNQFRFVATKVPTVDWAARALDSAQTAYYETADKAAGKPVSRAGHLWNVHLKEPDPLNGG